MLWVTTITVIPSSLFNSVINELTSQGISVLLISSDYPELLAMSDRIAVIRDGRVLHISEAKQLTEHRLLSIASGAELNHQGQPLAAAHS